jgi:hypothetical protein
MATVQDLENFKSNQIQNSSLQGEDITNNINNTCAKVGSKKFWVNLDLRA